MLATSGAFRTVRREPLLHPERKTWAIYLAEGLWVCGASVNSGGIVYRWLRDTFFREEAAQLESRGEDGYEAVNRAAAEAPPGAGGLLMLPYLAGERSPNWNVDARGVVVGLSLSHDRRHLARAAMEGISIHFAQVARSLFEICGPAVEVRATGGFRKSPLWVGMVADAMGQELALTPNVDASGLGAVLLGMRSLGDLKSLEVAAELIPVEERVAPDPARSQTYAAVSQLYERVYEALSPEFGRIASAALV